MSASVLAAIAALFQVVLSKYQQPIFVNVVIFRFTGKSTLFLSLLCHVLRLQ